MPNLVDRSNHRQAMRSLRAAEEKMARGVSVMIFPEGTRGPGGGVTLPFKRGGFVLAAETKAAIVPIAITGSTDVLGRRDWRIHAGDIRDIMINRFCASCGAKLLSGARFCVECGEPQPGTKAVRETPIEE